MARSRASLGDMSKCVRSVSTIWKPIGVDRVQRRHRLLEDDRDLLAADLAQAAAASGRPARWPAELGAAVGAAVGAAADRCSDIDDWVLPEPDSPTMASTSPGIDVVAHAGRGRVPLAVDPEVDARGRDLEDGPSSSPARVLPGLRRRCRCAHGWVPFGRATRASGGPVVSVRASVWEPGTGAQHGGAHGRRYGRWRDWASWPWPRDRAGRVGRRRRHRDACRCVPLIVLVVLLVLGAVLGRRRRGLRRRRRGGATCCAPSTSRGRRSRRRRTYGLDAAHDVRPRAPRGRPRPVQRTAQRARAVAARRPARRAAARHSCATPAGWLDDRRSSALARTSGTAA